MTEAKDMRTAVRDKYGAIASGAASGCCGANPAGVLSQIGYTAEQAASVPDGANLGLGCGNPLAYAALEAGETVLDLGSGAGIDCFLAAREVGPEGRVIGVDMTPEMLERARAGALRNGFGNVEFRLGEIEHLPVADRSVDAVISNCVINLSPDKLQVFREAHRVLRPGGRLVVSDLVLLHSLSPELEQSVELYVGCVAGASLRADYLKMMRQAGFTGVEVVAEGKYSAGCGEPSAEREAFSVVSSIKVRGLKT